MYIHFSGGVHPLPSHFHILVKTSSHVNEAPIRARMETQLPPQVRAPPSTFLENGETGYGEGRGRGFVGTQAQVRQCPRARAPRVRGHFARYEFTSYTLLVTYLLQTVVKVEAVEAPASTMAPAPALVPEAAPGAPVRSQALPSAVPLAPPPTSALPSLAMLGAAAPPLYVPTSPTHTPPYGAPPPPPPPQPFGHGQAETLAGAAAYLRHSSFMASYQDSPPPPLPPSSAAAAAGNDETDTRLSSEHASSVSGEGMQI